MDHERKAMVAFASVLAGSGMGPEFIAQWIASAIVSGAGVSNAEAFEFRNDIDKRIVRLLQDESLIWDRLLPGGPGDALSIMLIQRIEALMRGDSEQLRDYELLVNEIVLRLNNNDDTEAVEDVISLLEADGYLDQGWGETRKREREKIKDPVVVMLLTNQIDNPGWLVALPLSPEQDDAFKLHLWMHDPDQDSKYEVVSSNYGHRPDYDIIGRKDLLRVERADLSDPQVIANLQDVITKA